MRVLLDTHVLVWAVEAPAKIGAAALQIIQDPATVRFVSVASVWEIAIKVNLAKIQISKPFRPWVETAIEQLEADLLPIELTHGAAVAQLSFHHRDPFDRMLVAQALVEDVHLVSADAALDQYAVKRLW